VRIELQSQAIGAKRVSSEANAVGVKMEAMLSVLRIYITASVINVDLLMILCNRVRLMLIIIHSNKIAVKATWVGRT